MAARLLSGNDISFRLSKQTAKGAIDASPVFDVIRRTEGKARKQTSYVQSSEVKTNRQANQNIQDSSTLAADIGFEFTKQTVKYLQYAIEGTESTLINLTDTDIAADANGFTDAAGNGFAGLSVGDYFYISGFADSTIDGWYRLTVKNSDGDIETSPAPAATEVAGATVSVVSYRTYSDSDISYFTGQTQIVDESKAGNLDYFTVYDGYINSASFEVGEAGVITGNMALVFEQEQSGTAIISGQTDATADTSNVLSAINNVTRLWVDGVRDNCTVKSMGFEFSNNLQEDKAAGCVGSSYANGQMTLTGSINARLPIDDSLDFRDRYNAGTNVAFAAELLHTGSDGTIIEIPRAKVTEHEIPDGSNVVANAEMTYTAEEDSRGYTCVIYRNWQ